MKQVKPFANNNDEEEVDNDMYLGVVIILCKNMETVERVKEVNIGKEDKTV